MGEIPMGQQSCKIKNKSICVFYANGCRPSLEISTEGGPGLFGVSNNQRCMPAHEGETSTTSLHKLWCEKNPTHSSPCLDQTTPAVLTGILVQRAKDWAMANVSVAFMMWALSSCPHGLTFTWWGCCCSSLRHKTNQACPLLFTPFLCLFLF